AESRDAGLLNFETHGADADFWGSDELFVLQSQQRNLLQLMHLDRLLGRLQARLRETGLFDKCLLVVVADHGICFRAGESRRMVTPGNLADIMAIPLFIKAPGQAMGNISDRAAQSIDVLPTIADILGIKLPMPVDGRSLLDPAVPGWN